MLVTHYNVTLLESNLNTDTSFTSFTGEAFGAVVLETCASKSVC